MGWGMGRSRSRSWGRGQREDEGAGGTWANTSPQVSELVYKAVMADKTHSFTFEKGHKLYCKGFGSINAYLVKDTCETPPKSLLESLHLSPNYGSFYFDNPMRAGSFSKNR